MAFSLERSRAKAHTDIAKLRAILGDMPATAQSRYALAEIVLIRCAAILENSTAEIAYKICCGAEYRNGLTENIATRCTSLSNARGTLLSENGTRTSPKANLKWTKGADIVRSTKSIIDETGAFATAARQHSAIIAEIFDVRHFAAHRNASSRAKFKMRVRQVYGQNRNIQIGYFLLSVNLRPMSNLERYLRTVPVIIDDLTSG